MVNGALITTDRFGCNNESYFLRGPILLLSQILQLLIYGLGDFIFISNNSRSMHKYFVWSVTFLNLDVLSHSIQWTEKNLLIKNGQDTISQFKFYIDTVTLVAFFV